MKIGIKELEKLFDERAFTIEEVVRMEEIHDLKINSTKVRKTIKDGIFKGDKRSGIIYIRESELNKYIKYLGIEY